MQRFDSSTLQVAERTPQGGLRVPAYVTRVGIFTYTKPDGSKVREYRPAEEVFHTDSLASLYGAPVTIGHPGSVTPSNWGTHAVGHAEQGVATDTYVSASLRIQRADAVEGVTARTLSEVSCGYSVRIDATPGEYEGEMYDVVQRDIRYNHIALGPKHWGRAGAEVRLRLDSAGSELSEVAHIGTVGTKCQYTLGMTNPDLVAALEALAMQKLHSENLEKQLAERADGASKADARADAAEAKLLQLQTSFPAAVESRVALLARVCAIMGQDFSALGKSDRDLAIACVAKRTDGFTGEGKDDAYIMGRFDALDVADPIKALAEIKQDATTNQKHENSDREDAARTLARKITPPWEQK